MESLKTKIENYGTFNNWRGYVGLYFTKKEIKAAKVYGINENMTIKEAFETLNK